MKPFLRWCFVATALTLAGCSNSAWHEVISPEKMPDLPNFAATFARQSSWEWNFGQAPAFSHLLDERFTWGVIKGRIQRHKAVSRFLFQPAHLLQTRKAIKFFLRRWLFCWRYW